MIGAKVRIFVFRLVCFWTIWCYNQESRRFDEKFGDSRENRESWQVCMNQRPKLVPAGRLHMVAVRSMNRDNPSHTLF